MGSEAPPVSKSQHSARGFGRKDYTGEKLGSEPMPASKSQDSAYTIYASETDIQEPCRETMRRPKLQGYMIPEKSCTELTFAGRSR